jgi:hypothetical protein
MKNATSRGFAGGVTQLCVINAPPAAMNSGRAAFAKIAELIS